MSRSVRRASSAQTRNGWHATGTDETVVLEKRQKVVDERISVGLGRGVDEPDADDEAENRAGRGHA